MRAVIILAALLLSSPAHEAPVEAPSKWDAHILELEEQAIDEAFRRQVVTLYGTLMKDFSQPNVGHRVANGARNARAAYIRSMTQIEARRQ